MDLVNSYGFIIGASLIVILSYFFTRLSRRTNFPSVLLLIFLGIGLRQIDEVTGFLDGFDLMPILEVLGIIGLIMIVLEAALDLELTKDKAKLILRSLALALSGLLINVVGIAFIIKTIWVLDWYVSFVYAIPLSIMSSAIIIPSVEGLITKKREFMVYESTFSDILGIMMFYFFLGAGEAESNQAIASDIFWNVVLTLLISFLASYLLIFIFQKIRSGTKFFLMIAVLLLLYALAKQMHLSSLLIILVFGLILSNHRIFTDPLPNKLFDPAELDKIHQDFSMVTQESSFIVRTFFFFLFGLSISLKSLINGWVILISALIILVLYGSRYGLARLFIGKKPYPEWQIAPRGLITILLFFSIPQTYRIEEFNDFQGILLFVILVSSLVMGQALIRHKHQKDDAEDIEFVIDDRTDQTGGPIDESNIGPEGISME